MDGLWTGIRPVYIAPTSKMVSDYSGMMVQPHKVPRGSASHMMIASHTMIASHMMINSQNMHGTPPFSPRPLSVPTPLHMSRASIKMACSRARQPTRSCLQRRSVCSELTTLASCWVRWHT